MMRLRWILFLAGLLLVASAIAGVAQPRFGHSATTTPTTKTITVNGNGSVTTVPDRATFELLDRDPRQDGIRRADPELHRRDRRDRSPQGRRRLVGQHPDEPGLAAAADARRTGRRSSATSPRTASPSRRRSPAPARSSTPRSARAPTASPARASTCPIRTRSIATHCTRRSTTRSSRRRRSPMPRASASAAPQSITEGGSSTPFAVADKMSAVGAPIEAGTQEIQASVTVTYAVSYGARPRRSGAPARAGGRAPTSRSSCPDRAFLRARGGRPGAARRTP